MPRTVNTQQHLRQRRHIAQALWRLAARAGLEAVSLRDVAAEAGVSMGRVQHYFASKDEMLLFGLQMAQQRLEARVEQRLRDRAGPAGSPTGPADILRAVLDELLGEHPDTRQALLVSVAFYGRVASDPNVAAVLTAGDAEIRQLAATVVQEAQAAGRASPALSPEREADILLTIAGSLGVDVALGRRTIGEARETLTYALDRALGGIA